MNPAILLSLCIATINLATALVHLAISRAPGWRVARTFSVIALTAGLYAIANVVFCTGGLPDWVYQFFGRWNYFWATVHILAWYVFVFGGPDASFAALSQRLRVLVASSFAGAVFFAATGLHLQARVHVIPVPWAGVVYHYAVTTPLGDLYGLAAIGLLAVPYVQLIRRWWRGERALGMVVAGFTVFIALAVVEVLVANGIIVTISPVDIGFMVVVAPTSVQMLRRFIDDARRLNQLSGRLAGEVRDRTEERDRAESALLESERLAALGRLAAGVGHEINNPLTYLQLALGRIDQHLGATGAPGEVRETLADAMDGAQRIQKVVEGLRTYSRRQDERAPLEPQEIVRAALKVARPHLRHVASLETTLEATPRVLGDESRLVQAMVNLLVNAAQAVQGRAGAGHIGVRTARLASGEVVIEVCDDGPGIRAEDRVHLAEPYFTTRAPHGGLGLGLFVTRGIIDAHGGELVFESQEGRGTCVRIVLPALEVAVPAEPAVASAPPSRTPDAAAGDRAAASPVGDAATARPAGARARLLLVDDEPMVLRLLARVLASDWDVACARDGDEALALLQPGGFDQMACDLMMPGRSGIEVAAEVARRDPALRERMVFLTGGAVTDEAQEFLERPDVTYLVKPVDGATLDATLLRQMERVPQRD